MIPKIYDTQRIARIIGMDGETDQAMIDPTQPMPVKKIVRTSRASSSRRSTTPTSASTTLR
jgi:hypothetical protein